jgi:hypothetical protein
VVVILPRLLAYTLPKSDHTIPAVFTLHNPSLVQIAPNSWWEQFTIVVKSQDDKPTQQIPQSPIICVANPQFRRPLLPDLPLNLNVMVRIVTGFGLWTRLPSKPSLWIKVWTSRAEID